MCGIVGVIGNDRTSDILIQGLEKLEYRGYDSAGIFVENEHTGSHLVKSVGRIKALKEQLTPEITGTIGIGHTRWATHGVPKEDNAHPHTSVSGRFVLVHNGVIENFRELKEEYLPNTEFYGETDSEIAVKLIAKLVEEDGLDTMSALRKAMDLIKGSYAFGLVDKENPEVLYAAKNKSPMLIGLADGYKLIGSDAMAMIAETKEFMEIHDGEMVLLTKDKVEIFDENNQKVERDSYIATLDLSDIGKGTYPFYMLKEVDEQPAVMRRILQDYHVDGKWKIDEKILESLAQADRVYIAAAGTSWHAGYGAKILFEKLTGKPVELELASEFGYNMPILSERPFFIYLTQSGETADSRQVLVKTKQLGYPSLTITNVPGSTLSREADFTLLLNAGPEIAVASTKAYTAQIAVMSVLAKALGEYLGMETAKNFDLAKELSLVATAMEAVLSDKKTIEAKVAEYLTGTRNAFYIGRANDYYACMEAALKLKEISYIQCEGFAAGELKHGTIALIEEGTPVLALLSNKDLAGHVRGNIEEVKSRGAKVLTVAQENLAIEDDDIKVLAVHDYLTCLSMVVPTQLIAYYASLQRGLDVDKPRNLAKSVTVE